MSRAVVLGGGFAGVLVAAALADRVPALDEVVLVEGGSWPTAPRPRGGVPQGRHSHVLVGGGVDELERLLPGIGADLAAAGAQRRALPGGAAIRTADGWFHRHETGSYLLSCSRWLLDHHVRARALAAGRVVVRPRTRAVGLRGSARRVTGAVLRDAEGAVRPLPADLVIDATGRGSRATAWLAALGAPPVREETVDPGLAYATRVVAAPAELATEMPAVMVHPQPRAGREGHGATVTPIEDGRWVITLTGSRSDPPPTDEVGFAACARFLPTPLVGALLAAATPVGPVRPYRATVNRRRFVEHADAPAGFLVVGDALVAVNPVHSHGLTVAARGAARVAAELRARGPSPESTPAVQRALAEEAGRSWELATAPHRETGGRAAADGLLARLRRERLADPTLMAAFFADQTLAPGPSVAPADVASALRRPPTPALSDREAVAQYPQLARWWRSTGGH